MRTVKRNTGRTRDEWMTPPEVVERIRTILDRIDCDPASSERANKTVKARLFYTKERSGLDPANTWYGNTYYLNPPYSQPLGKRFVDRAIEFAQRGLHGIVLVNNSTDTIWFHKLLNAASELHLPKGRISFIDPIKGRGTQNRYGQAIFGLNLTESQSDRFIRIFAPFGWVGTL